MQSSATLTFSFSQANAGAWAPLLGGGIGISTTTGITLKHFLCDQLAIPPDYLENRIQTILVNSRAVDEVDQVFLDDGDVIALSAAMPGLAGATLRRGGHLAPMRAAISQDRAQKAGGDHRQALVVLKLFNLVAKEIGSQILSGEIWLKGAELDYLRDHQIISGDPDITPPGTEWIRLTPAPRT